MFVSHLLTESKCEQQEARMRSERSAVLAGLRVHGVPVPPFGVLPASSSTEVISSSIVDLCTGREGHFLSACPDYPSESFDKIDGDNDVAIGSSDWMSRAVRLVRRINSSKPVLLLIDPSNGRIGLLIVSIIRVSL